MKEIEYYINNFFTYQNPIFLAGIIISMVIGTIALLFIKIVIPLQKKFVLENQRYLLEKAELMALFAELDPDPLIRIDNTGKIIHTNEATRKIFLGIEKEGKTISEVLPGVMEHTNYGEVSSLEVVGEKYFSVIIRKGGLSTFTNIYLHDVTQIKNYENALESYKNRLKSFAKRLDLENEQLKKTLSAELHDDIGQQLISLKLKTSNMVNNKRDQIENDIELIYQKIRNLSHTLRPIEIKNLGLELSIQSLVQKVSSDTKIIGTFDYYGDTEILEPQIETCIYRTIQEALTNIIKHSKATEFSIQIGNHKDKINVIISDNGIGIPLEYFSSNEYLNLGTGLFSIRERISTIGGSLKINSIPNEGTTLFINFIKRIPNDSD